MLARMMALLAMALSFLLGPCIGVIWMERFVAILEQSCISKPPVLSTTQESPTFCGVACEKAFRIGGTKLHGFAWNPTDKSCVCCNDGYVINNRPDLEPKAGTKVYMRKFANSWTFNFDNRKCYHYESIGRTFYQAMDACAAYGNGTTLVKIESAAENTFVKSLFPLSDVWIGALQSGEPNNFIWFDGTPVVWRDAISSWHATDDFDFRVSCVVISKLDGFWGDVNCGVLFPSVCYGDGY
ncbi:unnamed protein product [Cyprideis torosa]|uniref:Uncharacterized protein n=1 Tax=Cyprideis torosa TaxID=163714 RepID=A0A7R8WDR1_9CRUS|nr:unnamed protein product [Cyprideis torosa]CAG0889377.1 unnamed protein product [Cyprideis torosa]